MFAGNQIVRLCLYSGGRRTLPHCQREMCAAASANETNSSASQEDSASQSANGATKSLLESQLSELKSKHEKDGNDFKSQICELTDKYKRSIAENENQRVRFNKKMEETRVFAIQKFSKDLLDISDTLSKALTSVPESELTDNTSLKNLFDGLRMTETQLHKVFSKHSLLKIDPLGEEFNPHEHEAVFYQPVEGKTSGTVIDVQKVGYKLQDRVIRPAIVGVAK